MLRSRRPLACSLITALQEFQVRHPSRSRHARTRRRGARAAGGCAGPGSPQGFAVAAPSQPASSDAVWGSLIVVAPIRRGIGSLTSAAGTSASSPSQGGICRRSSSASASRIVRGRAWTTEDAFHGRVRIRAVPHRPLQGRDQVGAGRRSPTGPAPAAPGPCRNADPGASPPGTDGPARPVRRTVPPTAPAAVAHPRRAGAPWTHPLSCDLARQQRVSSDLLDAGGRRRSAPSRSAAPAACCRCVATAPSSRSGRR